MVKMPASKIFVVTILAVAVMVMSSFSAEAQDQLCQQVTAAPAKDKTLVSGVLNALQNPNKLDAVLDIFTALNNWLKP